MKKQIPDKTQACQVCGAKLMPYSVAGLLVCPDCSFVTTDLKLSHAQLCGLYKKDYFEGGEYADYPADEALIKMNFKARLSEIIKYLPDHMNKSLFEIGSAYGFFLETAKGLFKSVAGIDISKDAAAFAKKRCTNVSCGDFLKLNIKKPVDVFCMWDTIEHLQCPAKFIKKISGKITKGGLFAVTTGDIGSLNARMRGGAWRQIRPPVHLHYFSKKSLTRLLEENGFRVKHVTYPGQFASLDNIFKIIFTIRSNNPGVYHFLKSIGLTKLNIYFNMFDLVYIIAEKI